MATNNFLPSPPSQRPRLDRHRDQSSIISHPSLTAEATGKVLPSCAPQTDPKHPVWVRQARTTRWTTDLQMRLETSNNPMAIHQKGVSSISPGKDSPFRPHF